MCLLPVLGRPCLFQVEICSRLILNGVCVRWRGSVDRNSLQGQGRLEFDEVRARVRSDRKWRMMHVAGRLELCLGGGCEIASGDAASG